MFRSWNPRAQAKLCHNRESRCSGTFIQFKFIQFKTALTGGGTLKFPVDPDLVPVGQCAEIVDAGNQFGETMGREVVAV